MRRTIILLVAGLPLILVLAPLSLVQADIAVDVSGNGEGTANSVNVSQNQETQVDQSNTATGDTNVNASANTGDNTIDGSSDTAQITTGDVTNQTAVVNQVNNSTVVADPCCDQTLDVTISGNGADSVNTIHTEVTSTTTINVTQLATINNNVGIKANTGGNTISSNGGDATIKTGSIKSHGTLSNIVNYAQLTVGPGAWDIHIINKDNGVDSTNVVYLDFVNNLLLVRNEQAAVNNNVYADLNTGNNKLLGNLNKALIETGDIDFSFDIANGPINVGGTSVICCDDGTPIDDPGDPAPNPGIPPQSNNSSTNNSSNSSTGGSVAAATVLGALVDILPATGASAFHFWMMAVMYLLTALSGLYLRLRAGRSPNFFSGYRLLAY